MVVTKVIPFRRLEGVSAEMSDDALAAALATGDLAALGALFDRHHSALRGFLGRLVGHDNPDLEDLAQTTFETVHRSAGKFRGGSSVKTWIFGIAANVARHHVRSRGRRRRLADAVSRAPEAPSDDPAAAAASSERAAHLQRAIGELPIKLREAFVLVYLEGMAGKQAAEVLGVREGTIYKRLHKARARLRDTLKGAIE